MDGLMSLATDWILSSGQDEGTRSNRMLNWESRKNPTDASSVALLRLSITSSIKDRSVRSEIMDVHPPQQQNKGRRRPKVDVQFLKSEEDRLCVNVSAFPDNSRSHDAEGGGDFGTARFSEPANDVQPLCSLDQGGESEEPKIAVGNDEDDREQASRKKVVENGLKLASRKFSDGIFENCSTYGLACQDVPQEREMSPKQESSGSKKIADEPNSAENPSALCQKSESVGSGALAEDDDQQISLSDSFFVNVVNGESTFSREGSDTSGKKSSRAVAMHANDERRFSRRLRKRRKKSKSKDIPTYECPACGVSYVLSANASDSTARCLHCDFWTSVEPVFLKREKQPWNTCRIC